MLVVCCAVLTRCASTKLSETWVDSSYAGGPVESVLVVGLGDDLRGRGLFEQELTSRLNSRGIAAVAGLGVTPTVDGPDETSLRAKARELDLGSVLVTRLLSVDTEKYYVSGQPMRYYGYFDPATGRSYGPGSWAEFEIVRLETSLYDVATDKLIWSAASETRDPPSLEKLARSLSQRIIDDLTRRGLLEQ